MTKKYIDHLELASALQVALLGMVTPNLRAVFFKLDDEHISCDLLYANDVGEAEVETASEIETELLADYIDWYKISVRALSWNGPIKPYNNMYCVYQRLELSRVDSPQTKKIKPGLEIQVALLGMVTPNLRRVMYKYENGSILCDLLYDGEPGPIGDEAVRKIDLHLRFRYSGECETKVRSLNWQGSVKPEYEGFFGAYFRKED